jgi:hypothetical protein
MLPSRVLGKVLTDGGSWLICMPNLNGRTCICGGELKMTPHLAALVKRVTELRKSGLWARHCAEEFTL